MKADATPAQRADRLTAAWAEMVNRRALDAVDGLFAEQVVFTATAPQPLVGRAAVHTYYDKAPLGLQVEVRVLAATATADTLCIAAAVRFTLPDGAVRPGRLSLAAGGGGANGRDRIALYQMCLTGA